jgi:hypothetical protein
VARTKGYTRSKRDYAQFDNRCDEHPKIAGLTDREYRIWTRSILYCSRNLTDGEIPLAIVNDRGWGRYVMALCQKGVWEQDVETLGIRVHDYLDWNDSKADVLTRIAQASTAGRSQETSKRKREEAQIEPPLEPLREHSESHSQKLPALSSSALDLGSDPTGLEPLTEPPSLAPTNGAKGRRPDQEMFEAVVYACGYGLDRLTETERGRVNRAAKELRDIEAEPALVRGFSGIWRDYYPDAQLTPQAITGNWNAYMTGQMQREVRHGRR